MSISIYKIQKWYNMLTGQSIHHVNQGPGTCYSKTEVAGYYNDLTEKVIRDDPDLLVPQYSVDTGETIYFSIGIFQYGLAAYDLFLKTNEQKYAEKSIACADWALANQREDGGWITFAFKDPKYPYSSMAQGEGISLLLRAYLITKESKYLNAAVRAKDFMLIPISQGGTACYEGSEVLFYEYTGGPLILNGWIFSLWGLVDYCKLNREDTAARKILEKSLCTMEKKLPEFDAGFWSKYDNDKRISSPFYHRLHIDQLKVMYDLFGAEVYREYAAKWEYCQHSFWKGKLAFAVKAWQKIRE